MTNPVQFRSGFALVIPFHNEEPNLPSVFAALRSQTAQHIPIVFIDSASTDGSAALVRGCEEVRSGQWICIEERGVGKIRAMRTGTVYCMERFGTRYVGFLDSDSYPANTGWLAKTLEIVGGADAMFGYITSPISYFGIHKLPVFEAAYLAYETVLRLLTERIGWLANGQGYTCPVEVLMSYFDRAALTTEVDLRCSLLALAQDRSFNYNPGLLMTSARRMLVNNDNFAAWCFYKREFYTKKDINAKDKINLHRPEPVHDLRPDQVPEFFARRALKVTSRHLMPMAIFGNSMIHEKIKVVLDIDVSAEIRKSFGQVRQDEELLLTDRFDTLIQAIERNPVCLTVAKRIEEMMRVRVHGEFPIQP